MKIMTVSLAALAAIVAATSAEALTISNRDTRSYKLQITDGSTTNTVEIKPQEELNDLCKQPCQVVIEGDSEPYELETADVVQIEEGQLYFADEAPQTPKQ